MKNEKGKLIFFSIAMIIIAQLILYVLLYRNFMRFDSYSDYQKSVEAHSTLYQVNSKLYNRLSQAKKITKPEDLAGYTGIVWLEDTLTTDLILGERRELEQQAKEETKRIYRKGTGYVDAHTVTPHSMSTTTQNYDSTGILFKVKNFTSLIPFGNLSFKQLQTTERIKAGYNLPAGAAKLAPNLPSRMGIYEIYVPKEMAVTIILPVDNGKIDNKQPSVLTTATFDEYLNNLEKDIAFSQKFAEEKQGLFTWLSRSNKLGREIRGKAINILLGIGIIILSLSLIFKHTQFNSLEKKEKTILSIVIISLTLIITSIDTVLSLIY